jgi:NTE family protein
VKLSSALVPGHDFPVHNGFQVALRCLDTLRGDRERYRLEQEGVGRRTMYVDTDGVSATDFAISGDAQRRLYESGRIAAERFLLNQAA